MGVGNDSLYKLLHLQTLSHTRTFFFFWLKITFTSSSLNYFNLKRATYINHTSKCPPWHVFSKVMLFIQAPCRFQLATKLMFDVTVCVTSQEDGILSYTAARASKLAGLKTVPIHRPLPLVQTHHQVHLLQWQFRTICLNDSEHTHTWRKQVYLFINSYFLSLSSGQFPPCIHRAARRPSRG